MKGNAVVLCGRCIRQPDVPKNPRAEDTVRCPVCGSTDTVARVLSQARQHATHIAARELEKRRTERGENVRRFTPTRAPVKVLKWISGLSSE